MRSSTIITLACAGLAAASPLVKRAYVTEIDTETVTVYVTEGDEPTSAAPTAIVAPTTTAAVEVVLTTTTPEAVASTTETSSEAPVETTTSAAATSAASTSIATVNTQSTSSGTVAGSTNAGSATTGCGLITPTDYASTAVYWHNIHRCNNSAPSVTWSDSLASSAATLAARCVFAHDVTINGGGYGQNIASYGTTASPESLSASSQVATSASEMWYNGEIGLYDDAWYGLANPDFTNFEGWGHYSQVVWKSTTQIGCASQYCSAGSLFSTMGGWFTVCNYNPAGNMGGEYGDNVLKPLGHATVHAS